MWMLGKEKLGTIDEVRMQNQLTNQHLKLNDHGYLEFTFHGFKELKPLFAKPGIDIHSIKTYDDYLIARRESSPYFTEWLCEQIGQHKINDAAKELFVELITNTEFNLNDAMARYQLFKVIDADGSEYSKPNGDSEK
jgi:hypothetical protein